MKTKTTLRSLLASAVLLAFMAPTQAAPVTIFNTGVNAAGVSQSDNSPETHYTLIAPGVLTGIPVVATSAGGFPIPPWLGDSAVSAWIAPTTDTNGVSGTYRYRTTFNLTGFIPSTAMLAGRWSTDNNGLDILINGTSTGQTTAFDSFLRYTLFSVTTGFVAGVNSLDFVVNNGTGSANPTGLRVEFTTAQATRIPEPGSLLLVGLGLVAAGVLRGRATGVRGAATAA